VTSSENVSKRREVNLVDSSYFVAPNELSPAGYMYDPVHNFIFRNVGYILTAFVEGRVFV